MTNAPARPRMLAKTATAFFRRAGRTMPPMRAVALALLLALTGLRIWSPHPLEALQVRIFDLYQWLRPADTRESETLIVDIDERSLAELGQWPWPRSLVGELIARVVAGGAAVVAMDIVFAEPDRLSPASLARAFGSLPPDVVAAIEALPDTDRVLADAIAKGRVVVGQSASGQAGAASSRPVRRTPIAEIGGSPKPFLLSYPGMVRNIAPIENAAQGRGVFTIAAEPDGIIRRVPALIRIGDEVFPTLSVEALRVATGQTTLAVKSDAAGVHSVVVAGAELFTDNRGRLWPHFSRHDPGRYLAAVDVLTGRVDAARFAGKVVLFGTSAAGLLDIKTTPVDRALPGVEVHAMLIDGALAGRLLSRPNFADGLEVLLILFIGAAAIVLVPRLGARSVAGLFAFVVAAVSAGSWYAFVEDGILLDASVPTATAALLFGFLAYANYSREEAQRRAIRSAFSHYMAPAMVERLVEHPEMLRLGGESREITVLFADLRDFTSMSETLEAQALVSFMNRYFTPMTAAIQERSGTIDKYIGDEIMAFWNAPLDDSDHARHACQAVFDMRRQLDVLNAQLHGEAKSRGEPFQPIRFGIGIVSGMCAVGNFGSEQHFDYSVLGDTVNLAARLQSQTKEYGIDAIISESTVSQAGPLAALEIDLIRVKGKTQPARIYALLGDETLFADSRFLQLAELHKAMLTAYRQQDWPRARHYADAAGAIAPAFALSGLYRTFADRIDLLAENPPPQGWDSVFVATRK